MDTHGLNLTQAEVEEMLELTDGDSIITVSSVKVSASEKVSTGKYENYNPHATMEALVIESQPWETQEDEVLGKILEMHRGLQEVLDQATSERLAAEEPNPEEMR